LSENRALADADKGSEEKERQDIVLALMNPEEALG